jgi:hypothetical protein
VTRLWEDPFPFELRKLANDDGSWEALAATYRRDPSSEPAASTGTDRPLRRCLDVAKENGARTVVIETRYIDADYRSEYSAFYSRAFAHFEDSAHRLHFFKAELGEEEVWRLPEDPGYLGYVVIRPQVRGVVGRTMLAAPESFRRAVRTGVREPVTFFGQRLGVRAVPFIQQDARLGSCAHAAAWMCHYSAFRAGRGVPRRMVAEFSQAVNPALGVGRPLPSTGLTLNQLSDVLGTFGLPPLYYEMAALLDSDRPSTWPPPIASTDARTKRLCCRYLNSGIPVIAVVRQWRSGAPSSDRHAIVACGYVRSDDDSSHVSVIVHDDRRGPYLLVDDVEKDVDSETGEHLCWDQILTPLPEKLWMSGEAAERKGCEHLIEAARRAADAGVEQAQVILERFEDNDLSVRTYATTSNRFKERLRRRCGDDVIVREYSLTRLPRFVWVVEAIDRPAREKGAKEQGARDRYVPCVLGEVVFDATSDDLDPAILATRVLGLLAIPRPQDPRWDTFCSDSLVASGGQYDP